MNKNENQENANLSNPFAKRQKEAPEIDIEFEKENSDVKETSEFIFRESDYLAPSKIHENLDFIDSSTLKDALAGHKNYFDEKSLKTAVIFESDKALNHWKKKMSNPLYIMDSMKDTSSDNMLFYYRYPDVSLPHNQKKNIHKSLSNISKKSNDENLSWYRMFSEKWRQALLSVFDTFKHGFVDNFYFIQENLTVLFERRNCDSSLKARMQLTSLALAEDLKNNGTLFCLFVIVNF